MLRELSVDFVIDCKSKNINCKEYIRQIQELKYYFDVGFENEYELAGSKIGSYLSNLERMISNLKEKQLYTEDLGELYLTISELNRKSCQQVLQFVSFKP